MFISAVTYGEWHTGLTAQQTQLMKYNQSDATMASAETNQMRQPLF